MRRRRRRTRRGDRAGGCRTGAARPRQTTCSPRQSGRPCSHRPRPLRRLPRSGSPRARRALSEECGVRAGEERPRRRRRDGCGAHRSRGWTGADAATGGALGDTAAASAATCGADRRRGGAWGARHLRSAVRGRWSVAPGWGACGPCRGPAVPAGGTLVAAHDGADRRRGGARRGGAGGRAALARGRLAQEHGDEQCVLALGIRGCPRPRLAPRARGRRARPKRTWWC